MSEWSAISIFGSTSSATVYSRSDLAEITLSISPCSCGKLTAGSKASFRPLSVTILRLTSFSVLQHVGHHRLAVHAAQMLLRDLAGAEAGDVGALLLQRHQLVVEATARSPAGTTTLYWRFRPSARVSVICMTLKPRLNRSILVDKRSAGCGARRERLVRARDSNPHDCSLEPKPSASTSSATPRSGRWRGAEPCVANRRNSGSRRGAQQKNHEVASAGASASQPPRRAARMAPYAGAFDRRQHRMTFPLPPPSRRDALAGTLAGIAATILVSRAAPAEAQAPAGEPTMVLTAAPAKRRLRPEPAAETEVWAYNGEVPGPLIRLKQGQPARIRLENRLPQPTSLHFSGSGPPMRRTASSGSRSRQCRPAAASTPSSRHRCRRVALPSAAAGGAWPHVGAAGARARRHARGRGGELEREIDREIMLMLDDWRLTEAHQVDPAFAVPPTMRGLAALATR